MRFRVGFLAVLATWLLAGHAVPASGQDEEPASTTRVEEEHPWYVMPNAGAFLLDDGDLGEVGMASDPTFIVGVRAGYVIDERWSVEGSYGYSPLNGSSAGFGDIDGGLHVYYGAVNYALLEEESTRVFLSGGLGAMRYSYDEFERRGVLLQDVSWANEVILPLGVGIEFGSHERVSLRFDGKYHVQFCRAEDEPIDETEDFSHCPLDDTVLWNPEITGGITIRL